MRSKTPLNYSSNFVRVPSCELTTKVITRTLTKRCFVVLAQSLSRSDRERGLSEGERASPGDWRALVAIAQTAVESGRCKGRLTGEGRAGKGINLVMACDLVRSKSRVV